LEYFQRVKRLKILFLCGSLEPGRDGVGDCVKNVAGELRIQGHQAAAIALNDGFINSLHGYGKSR
jgi:hypothetical protein